MNASHLGEFYGFLEMQGLKILPGKGQYQLRQVEISRSNKGIVFKKADNSIRLSNNMKELERKFYQYRTSKFYDYVPEPMIRDLVIGDHGKLTKRQCIALEAAQARFRRSGMTADCSVYISGLLRDIFNGVYKNETT